MAVERTLSIIKPDATRRNLTGKVNARFEDAGLERFTESLDQRSPAPGQRDQHHPELHRIADVAAAEHLALFAGVPDAPVGRLMFSLVG